MQITIKISESFFRGEMTNQTFPLIFRKFPSVSETSFPNYLCVFKPICTRETYLYWEVKNLIIQNPSLWHQLLQ